MKIQRIENGIKIQFFKKDRHRDHLNTLPGRKDMNNQWNFDWKINIFRNEKPVNNIGFTMKSMFLQVFEKVERSMPKEMPKVIVDAERSRRTLLETGESAFVVWRWGQL